MKAQAFFDRAIREAQRYGDDPWIFLRELVQNSRDAGATHIYCHTQVGQDWTYLDFQDNGEGMSATGFEGYLLRLYASSKEQDQAAIGYYGVGFWSTLLFKPKLIRIFSRHLGQSIGYEIDCRQLKIHPMEAHLKHDGTRITLIRERVPGDCDLAHTVRAKLSHYTGPVRPAPNCDKLVLLCNGEQLNQPFDLPPHFGRRIREPGFDGSIGLGNQPWVKLYKGGILVRDLTSLEEVLPNRSSRLPPTGLGLYPQIAINADGLTVLMDRQSVFEDPLLQRIVQVCENRLLKIQRQMVQQMFPMNWPNRLLHWSQRFSLKHLSGLLLILVLIGLAFWRGRSPGPGQLFARSTEPASKTRQGYIDTAFNQWHGPTIDSHSPYIIDWQFQYEGGPPYLLFRMATLSRFDKRRGWLPAPHQATGPYPQITWPSGETPILVRIHTRMTNEPIALPVPPKYHLVANSIVTASGIQPQVFQTALGEPLVTFQQPQQLSYQVVAYPAPPPKRFHQALTVDEYPIEFATFFQSLEGLANEEKAKRTADFLTSQFKYSRSPNAALQFERASGSFLDRIRKVGGGDCDLLNGLYALMLQTAGLPAYLSVGLVGRQGGAESSLHAWVRYWVDGRWITADIIAPQHFRIIRPNQVLPIGTPANLDQTAQALPSQPTSGTITLPKSAHRLRTSDQALPSAQAGWPNSSFLVLLTGMSLGGLGWFLFRRKQLRKHPRLDQPNYLAHLFENYFRHGLGNDPLRLDFRPLFPTLQGKLLSLFQIRRLMQHAPILGAKKDCPLVALVSPRIPILDRDQPHYQLLSPFLPSVVWLDELKALAFPNPLPPGCALMVKEIQKIDPDFRLHIKPHSDLWREYLLPFRDKSLGKRHIIIGDQNPNYLNLLSLESNPTQLELFEAIRLILEKCTFYISQRDDILARLAKKINQVA